MNVDFIELWLALDRLPLLFSILIYAIVLLMTVSFVALPTWLLIRSEPSEIYKEFMADLYSFEPTPKWRLMLHKLAACLTVFNTAIGRVVAWLILYMTLMQFVVVIMRYVFSYGSIQMQESIWYMHGLMFMLGAGYTLVKDGHVRLDVFYRELSKQKKAVINIVGAVVFLIPFCVANFDFAWSLVLNSWAVREGSTETAGLPYIYLFKTVILIFSALVALEGLSLALRSILDLTDKQESEPEPMGA